MTTETTFIATSDYTFPWPVKISRPHPTNAGDVETQTFTGHFRLLDDEAGARLAAGIDGAMRSVAAIVASEKAQIRATLIGWDDRVVDESHRPIPFGPDALENMMRWMPFRRAVIAAYAEAVRAGPAEGN